MNIALAAAAVLASFASVSAATAQTAPVATVSYADLDMSSTSGLATLNGRIVRAAHTMCDSNGVADLAERAASKACYRTAVAGARKQMPGHPLEVASR